MSFSTWRLVKNASCLFSGNIGVAITSFVQGVIITRALGPSEFGVWSSIVAFTVLIRSFLGFRTSEALTRVLVEFRDSSREKTYLLISTALITDFLTNLASCIVIVVIISLLGSDVAHSTGYNDSFYLYSLVMMFSFADNVWYSLIRDQKNFKKLAIFPLTFLFFQTIIIFILWNLNLLNILSLVSTIAVTYFIRLIITIQQIRYMVVNNYHIDISKYFLLDVFRRQGDLDIFWCFMKSTFFSSIVSTIVKNGDVLILGYYGNTVEVGWYSLAKKLAGTIHQIGMALASVIYQDINEMIKEKQTHKVFKGIRSFSKVWIPIVVILLGFGLILSKPIVGLIYTGSFEPASIAFNIILTGESIAIMFFWAQPLVLALDKLRENLILVVINGIISILLCVILTAQLGYIGTSISSSVAWIFGYIGLLWIINKSKV